MKNWKTTLGGVLVALALSIQPSSPISQFIPQEAKQWISIAGLVGATLGGAAAKDAKKSDDENQS